jgi:ABC-type lipoprotein release transport system permease subunit
MNILKLAWRNLGRNLRRTAITGTALAFGISLCVASYGLVDGLSAQMLHALTRLDVGHIQIHTRAFVEQRSLQEHIEDPGPVIASAESVPATRAVAPRGYGFALVSGQGHSSGVELVGVDPPRERQVTELDGTLIDGRYLDDEPTPWPEGRTLTADERELDRAITEAETADVLAEIDALDSLEPKAEDEDEASEAPSGAERASETEETPTSTPGPEGPDIDEDARRAESAALALALSPPPDRPPRVILGTSLAKVLGVSVGDRIYASTLTVDGQSESAFLEVAGIYQTGTQLFDRHRVYLNLADLQRLTHLGKAVHEIAIAIDDPHAAATAATAIADELDDPDLVVRPWQKVRPDVEQMLKLNEVSTDIMVFIIFVVATLGVVNTMLMSVFERTRELGVLKAIGMSGGRIVALIVSETVLLVLAASIAGTGLGLAMDGYMVTYGVDLTRFTQGLSLAGIGINPVIKGVVTLRGVIMPTIVLSLSCLFASLYPAIRAARLEPAIGMRET